jgi:Endonuclease/Exonuclease/phosphatase family.
MAAVRVIQANLNHARGAQDLLVHTIAERGVGLAVAAEPYRVPDHPNWVGDTLGSVVIATGTSAASPGPPRLLERGPGYVAAELAGIAVVAVYAPPGRPLEVFERTLDSLAGAIRRCPSQSVLVLGDFNAKATAWGSPRTNARGDAVLDWAAGLELRLLNRGSATTCRRWQGESVIDLSWATPLLVDRVAGWRVLEGVETLSDHVYIEFTLSGPSARRRARTADGRLLPRPRACRSCR